MDRGSGARSVQEPFRENSRSLLTSSSFNDLAPSSFSFVFSLSDADTVYEDDQGYPTEALVRFAEEIIKPSSMSRRYLPSTEPRSWTRENYVYAVVKVRPAPLLGSRPLT